EDVQINFGVILNESMEDAVKITVIATGFLPENAPMAERHSSSVERQSSSAPGIKVQARPPEPEPVRRQVERVPTPEPVPAQLAEVVFELNFPNLFAVETGIAEYQQRVETLYPNSGGEYVVRLPSAAAFGKPSRPEGVGLKPMRSFVFQNPMNSRTIRVSVVN